MVDFGTPSAPRDDALREARVNRLKNH